MKKILILAMCLAIVPMLFASQRNLERSAVDVDVAHEFKTQENILQEAGDRARKIPEDAFDVVVSSRQLLWDFEDGWQGWTNTNGNAFPYAWGVERYNLNGSYWVCPNAGDSSMWIDSDAAGYGYWLEDTVQSPILFPYPTMDWLKYGLAFNRLSYYEYLEVGIKYFDGATWTVVPLKKYTADYRGWDQVDVSAYAGYPSVQIYFFYIDKGRWCWYGAFDNVSIDASLTPPIVWDFEDGWQGWTHTNGLPFPGGWEPYDATYRAGRNGYQCPSSDDSSMCIDSDLYFGATMDTALSPFLVPLPDMDRLEYGLFYNDLATHFDYFEVGIKYFDGSTWTVAPLKTYDSDYNGDWESVDVSAYSTYDLIQVYFYYHAPGWDYYAAFDNVSLGFGVRPAEHDVGCDQITSPPAGTTLPGDYDVIGNINLFGDFIETFDATATVYDTLAGWIVVFKTTLTLTNFSPGAESLVNFGMVTLEDNKVYYTEIYTELVGDEHPENDTTTATCETSSQLWKIYADMPQASYYNAAVYTDVTATPTVYSVGGDPTYTSIFEFDCNTETWSTSSATLNHQARRLAAAVVDGKIYAIGGMPGSGSTALNYCQEYDPVAGTVTDKTAMPTARQFLGAVAWNDTLIYVMGGQSGSSYYSTIEIYDPANDAWTTATPLPEANRSFACGIAGDIIYVTGGYSGSGYRTATRIGVIDPTNPQSITWSSGPDIPIGSSGTPGRSRVQGACVDKGTGWVFYFTGGDDHGGSYPAYDTWYYDPNDALWHQDLDKPTPISNSQCAVYVPILDQGTFFCCGGYNTATGSGTAATEGLINLTPPTGIAEEPDETATLVFGLSKIAPNPVKDGATVSYTTTRKGPVSLKVYDCAGRLVRTLIDRNEIAGHKTVYWDGKDANHRSVAAGVYFYRLVAEEKTSTKKMVVVR